MTCRIPRDKNHKLYMDNYFTTTSNVLELCERKVWVTGTIRSNRLKGAQSLLKSKKVLEETGRGSSDSVVYANSGLCALRWLDNGIVTMLS